VDRTGCTSISVAPGMMDGRYDGTPNDVTANRGGTVTAEDVISEMYGKHPFMKIYMTLQGCEAFQKDDQYVGVGARCCVLPKNGMNFQHWQSKYVPADYRTHVEAVSKGNSGTGDCQSVGCPAEDETVGCAGGQGSGWSSANYKNLVGNRQVGDTCYTRRSTDGQITNSAICGSAKGGNLKCTTLYSGVAGTRNPDTGVYWASANCPREYSLTDCNAWIWDTGYTYSNGQATDAWQEETCVNEAYAPSTVTYGEFVEAGTCYALGSGPLIKAQSRCCKVE